MPKPIKGSEEAKERAKKMREGKQKKEFEKTVLQRIDNLASTIARVTDGFDKRLQKLEEQPQPNVARAPFAQEPKEETSKEKQTPVEGLELLPSKAKEILNQEFPEAKLYKVKPHKGGVLVIVDLTHITGGLEISSMVDGKPKRQRARDYRNIPVKAMQIEKSMKERIKDIKKNIGWIKEEKVPQKIEREVRPSKHKKDLPPEIEGTPEAQFFTNDVK